MNNKLMPQVTFMFYLLLFSALLMILLLSPNLATRQISQPQFFQRTSVNVPIVPAWQHVSPENHISGLKNITASNPGV